MDTIKKIYSEVCVFDLECVPDTDAGRRLLADEVFTRETDGAAITADEAEDEQIAQMMIEKFANDKGILKTVLYKVASIATVIRQVTTDGVKLSLRNITLSEERDERAVISTFMTYLGTRRPQIVGFATSTFDLGVLWQRAIALGINVAQFTHRPAKPWDEYADYFSNKNDFNVDLLQILGGNWGTMPRLSQFCCVAKIPCKLAGVSGQSVLGLYLDNELEKIADYCEDDACATYLLWLQCIAAHGLFTAEQIEVEKKLFLAMLTDTEKPHCIAFRDEHIALNTEHVEEMTVGGDTAQAGGDETVAVVIDNDSGEVVAKASMLADLITSKQINMVNAIAHEAKIDAEAVCHERFHCKIEELGKRYASDFIDILQAMQHHAMPKPTNAKLSALATTKQKNFIGVLQRDRKFTDEQIEQMCQDSVHCSRAELTQRSASLFIDTLQNAPGNSNVVHESADAKTTSVITDDDVPF